MAEEQNQGQHRSRTGHDQQDRLHAAIVPGAPREVKSS
jgi:hypothetical protein